MNFIISLVLFWISAPLLAQELSKECFSSNSIMTNDEMTSEYCVVGKKILRIDQYLVGMVSDTVETYVDTVTAYYSKTKKIKYLKIYNAYGYEEGSYVAYYPNGKVSERGSYKNGVRNGVLTNYYQDGKLKSTIQLLEARDQIVYSDETNFRIVNYRDSLGAQLVKNGNGYCNCVLRSGRREVGKVVEGMRDSVWSEYSGDTLILMETYAKGQLQEGVRFHKGKKYLYNGAVQAPEYAGGYDEMMEILRKNLRYPVSARRAGIDGKVELSFIVKTDGTIGDVVVTKGVSKELDEEAVRVTTFLTDWTPGKWRGKPEPCRFNLPVKYKIN